jgi:hypothetical protein
VVWFKDLYACAELIEGGCKRDDLGLQASDTLAGARGVMRGYRWIGIGFGAFFGQCAEEMSIAGLAGAGLTGENDGEGTGFIAGCVTAWTTCETFEGGLDGGKFIEGIETVGAAAEFTWSLRAAEHKETEDGRLVAAEVEDGTDAVLILWDAGVANRSDERKIFEGVKGLADLFLGEIEDGIAARALVARVEESVEGERIVFGRGDLFFDEGAEDAELDGVEMHVYKGDTGEQG